MDVIPAVDIRGGRCVRLYQGDYEQETVFADDPTEVARGWQQRGARRLHIVDLDGARDGVPANRDTIVRIIGEARVPVQIGGGIRSLEMIAGYVDAGADRIVLGTSAVRDEALMRDAVARFGERIAVSIDARDGLVATDGWTKGTTTPATDAIRRLAALGVARFIYTDVGRDGTLTEPNYGALEEIVRAAGVPVIAAGGIAKVEHLARLAALGVEGAIVGRALYTGDIELEAALAATGS